VTWTSDEQGLTIYKRSDAAFNTDPYATSAYKLNMKIYNWNGGSYINVAKEKDGKATTNLYTRQ